MFFLSIIIPAYNEAERLPDTLKQVREYLEKVDFTAEIVVVDDGSTDGTPELVKKYMTHFSNLHLIENKENKGKGGVVRQGMLQATGEWRLFMDADSSTPLSELDKLLPFIKHYEVVIGSRYLKKDSIKLKQSLKRRIISRGGNFLIQRTLLPGVVDTQCGFKLFSARAATAIFSEQSMNGWAFDVEVLTIAYQHGFQIKEVPVDWYDSKSSKLRAAKAAVSSLDALRKIHRKVKDNEYGHKKL